MTGERNRLPRASEEGLPLPWRTRLPTLRASGLTLRELESRDEPHLVSLAASQLAWPISVMVPRRGHDAARFVAGLRAERRDGRGFSYGILSGVDDAVAGVVRVRRLDAGFRIADGAFVFSEAVWDSPVPAAATQMVLALAFGRIGVHRIELRTMAAREAALVRDLGAVAEGRLRESWIVGDRLVDQHLWSMLGHEWPLDPAVVPVPGLRIDEHADATTDDPGTGDDDASSPLWATTPPFLRSHGVTVREIRPEDAPVLLGLFTPDEIQVCIDPPTTSLEMFGRYIRWAQASRLKGSAVSFVVLTDDQPEPVGLVQVRQMDRRAAVADMGILLARQYRGSGLFARASRLVLDFAFLTMGVHRLEARTSSTNQAGEASLKKLGAVREAHLRASFPRGDAYEDDELWAVLSDDWRRIRANA